jgi:hypothetical protein
VPSWRDKASAEAQADLDGLAELLLGVARGQLAKRGALAPCGAAIDPYGAQRLYETIPEGAGEVIDSSQTISTMVDGLRRRRPRDRDGHAMRILLPYVKKRFGRGIEYANLRAAGTAQRIWNG